MITIQLIKLRLYILIVFKAFLKCLQTACYFFAVEDRTVSRCFCRHVL